MKKQLVASLGVVCLLSAGAFAGEGIPSNILDDMGLSGIEVLSDGDALAVRGMGAPKIRAKKPWVSVGGDSHAHVGATPTRTRNLNGIGGGSARSSDWYKAAGKYYAAGGSESVAGHSTIDTKIRRYNGHVEIRKSIHTKQYFSGGSAWGKAF